MTYLYIYFSYRVYKDYFKYSNDGITQNNISILMNTM